jgi:hypothetical protein
LFTLEIKNPLEGRAVGAESESRVGDHMFQLTVKSECKR